MKKVLIFSLQYYPFVGGAEVAIKEITDRISPEQYEFHMLTSRFDSSLPKIEKVGNITVYRIGLSTKSPGISDLKKLPLHLNKFLFQILAVPHALSLHSKLKFNATWGMMAHATAIPAGLFKSLKPLVPYVLTLQEGDPTEYIEKMMKPVWPLFRQGFVRADALQPISTFLLNWGKRMGFSGAERVIPNGVDTARFTQTFTESQVQEMKEKLGKKQGDVFVVTTSRLVHKNAVDDVIRALTHLPNNVHFLIYGIGPDEEKLRYLAKNLGVEDRAHFMGQIGHQEMPLMLAACDIFTRPSRSEGMGNSFIEAMAAGLPIIATQEGGISDFLFDKTRNPNMETTGWAVDADAPLQIAAAVTDIVEHPQQVTQVVEAAKALALSGYDWDTIAESMQELFDDVTG